MTITTYSISRQDYNIGLERCAVSGILHDRRPTVRPTTRHLAGYAILAPTIQTMQWCQLTRIFAFWQINFHSFTAASALHPAAADFRFQESVVVMRKLRYQIIDNCTVTKQCQRLKSLTVV